MDSTFHLLLIVPLLALACWTDLTARIIPDALNLVMALLGIAMRLPLGTEAMLASLLASSALFVTLLICATRGWIGGGDVKLAGAIALGLTPAASWDFIFATTMSGGLLALVYSAGPRFAPRTVATPHGTLLARIYAVESWRLSRRGPLPYGLAITAGAIIALATSP